MHERIKILDVPVDKVDYEQAEAVLENILREDGCDLIVTPNSEIILQASKNPEMKKIIESARLIIPDGIGLVYASKLLKEPLKERVTGIDFLNRIFGQLSKNGQSVFFFGSAPGVAERAANNIQKSYPDLKIAGARDGYFQESEEEEIVEQINRSGAEFLCVALGAPKQEKFIYRYKDRLKVKGAIGVGGSLDVLAGELKRAPEFFQDHGLEWLYRFAKQPTRFKRMMRLPLFMIKVIVKGKDKK